jgi:hypothetical protein
VAVEVDHPGSMGAVSSSKCNKLRTKSQLSEEMLIYSPRQGACFAASNPLDFVEPGYFISPKTLTRQQWLIRVEL